MPGARFEPRKKKPVRGLSREGRIGRPRAFRQVRGLRRGRGAERGLRREGLCNALQIRRLIFAPLFLFFHKYRAMVSPTPPSPSGGSATAPPPAAPTYESGETPHPRGAAAPRPPGGLRPPALRAAPSLALNRKSLKNTATSVRNVQRPTFQTATGRVAALTGGYRPQPPNQGVRTRPSPVSGPPCGFRRCRSIRPESKFGSISKAAVRRSGFQLSFGSLVVV